MNPMNTQTNKPTKRIPHVRVLSTLATLCLIQSLIANIAFAQAKYSLFSDPLAIGGTQGPTGVRGAGGQDVYVTGIYHPSPTPPPPCSVDSHGLLYTGPLSGGGASGSWTQLDASFPGATVTGTALYGPDTLPPSDVRLVGSYTACETGHMNHGLLYQGPPDGSGSWQTIDFPISAATPSPSPGEQVLNTIAHSTMGGLVVGNFDTNLLTGRAFVYDIAGDQWTELPKPTGVISITAYGIWYNGGTSYTIAGGYAELGFSGNDQHGYLLNWDSSTHMVSDWTPYDFDNGPHTPVEISHFDGITTDNQGGFYLTGTWLGGVPQHIGGFFAHVRAMPHYAFGKAHWTDIEYPSSPPGLNVDSTTGNTVFENNVLGIFMANGHMEFQGYLAAVQGHR